MVAVNPWRKMGVHEGENRFFDSLHLNGIVVARGPLQKVWVTFLRASGLAMARVSLQHLPR
jgi:hypothetical protein